MGYIRSNEEYDEICRHEGEGNYGSSTYSKGITDELAQTKKHISELERELSEFLVREKVLQQELASLRELIPKKN